MTQNLKALIGPSIINLDLSRLYEESEKLLRNGADYLHLDVMDGHFVNNLTIGHPVVKTLRNNIKDAYLETHMMVAKPEQWIVPMAEANVDLYTFHIESTQNADEVCRKIRENGMKAGLAIKPGTSVMDIEKYISIADVILVMTIEPGFGGQKFMEGMLEKVQWLRENHPLINIEVDGGVGLDNIGKCANAGANMIVSGRAIISAADQAATIQHMRDTVQKAIYRWQRTEINSTKKNFMDIQHYD